MTLHTSAPANLQTTTPTYYAESFDISWNKDSSDSPLDPYSSISQYGYDSSNLAPQKRHRRHAALSARVYTTISDAVRSSTSIRPSSSSHTPLSIADSTSTMLARANSIRLSGLLNRTPTPRQQNKQVNIQEPCEEEASDADECEELPEYKPTFTSTPDRTTRTPTQTTSSRAKRFTWFSQPKQGGDHTSAAAALELSDPLIDLNVNAALFPTGATDPLNPDSFNSLLTNACALISTLQAGYRQKTTLLKQANAERDAVREESDEASTRVSHLKSQLETMAMKAAEQDRAMQDLAEELAQARARLERQRHDSMRPDSCSEETPRRRPSGIRPSMRRSHGSLASDSDLESDLDDESVSYSLDTASTTSVPATPGTMSTTCDDQLRMEPGKSVSWNVVGDLQRENQRLRGRVRELEGAVEGCLSLVGR